MGKRLVLKYGTYLLIFVALPNQLYKNVFFVWAMGGMVEMTAPVTTRSPTVPDTPSPTHAQTHTRAHTHTTTKQEK